MNLVWPALVIVVAVALAVTAMLLVRRGAPEGSRFTDGDRASGVFGVLATGFSVLLGFVVFLAFESYDQSRSGAEEEALVLSSRSRPLSSWVPRSPVSSRASWCATAGRSSTPNGRARSRASRVTRSTRGESSCSAPSGRFSRRRRAEEAAYGKWLDQTSDREAARVDRIHGAVGVIPTPLWVVLLLISVVVFVFMLFFADRSEGAVTQAVLMGSVTTVVVSMLLLIEFLDSPFHDGNRRRPSSRDGENASNRRRGAAGRRCPRGAAL